MAFRNILIVLSEQSQHTEDAISGSSHDNVVEFIITDDLINTFLRMSKSRFVTFPRKGSLSVKSLFQLKKNPLPQALDSLTPTHTHTHQMSEGRRSYKVWQVSGWASGFMLHLPCQVWLCSQERLLNPFPHHTDWSEQQIRHYSDIIHHCMPAICHWKKRMWMLRHYPDHLKRPFMQGDLQQYVICMS